MYVNEVTIPVRLRCAYCNRTTTAALMRHPHRRDGDRMRVPVDWSEYPNPPVVVCPVCTSDHEAALAPGGTSGAP